ncbi:speckle-type POZ protein-like [Ornithodoros turicata]|uniref:speckle-type POZ protein-like n=1 Tax=Ornithodoros turicata TaxID=34597 RepID=UPI00313A4D17
MAGFLKNSSLDTEYYMNNKVTEATCRGMWVIENFSVQFEEECIESAKFQVGDSEWCFKIYDKYDATTECNYSSIELLRLGNDPIEAKCDFLFLNDEARKSIKISRNSSSSTYGMGWNARVADVFKPYLSGDVLTLCFELTTYKTCRTTLCSSIEREGPTIQDDLRQLKISNESSDVVLVAHGGKKIRAHKLVLAMRSPVFRAMFANDMKEKRESEVNLKDTDAALVEEMLTFMYTDSAPNIKSMAADLILLADKYDLERLKFMCERELSLNFSVGTVVDVLRWADKLNRTHLADAAVRYINLNSSDVRKTDSWKVMVQEEPQLLERIYCALQGQVVNSSP